VASEALRNIARRLNAEINKALQSPAVYPALLAHSLTPVGGTPDQFAEHVQKKPRNWES